MVFAVDIGNTNIVVGCFEENRVCFEERISTNKHATTLEYLVLFKTVLELHGLSGHPFEGGIISSVVPTVTASVREAMETLSGKSPLVVGPGLKSGLTILLDNPEQLGSDRVADAVAAVEEYPCPLIIVDMGTATTISVVDGEKNFVGGMIMPGLLASIESLSSRASQLPYISLDQPKAVIGRNTVDCMRSGIIYGCAASVDGAVARIERELGQRCTVVTTGGISRLIAPYLTRDVITDEQLLLKGLMLLYRKNQANS